MKTLPDLREDNSERLSFAEQLKVLWDKAGPALHIPVSMLCVFSLVIGSMYMLITAHGHAVVHGLLVMCALVFSVGAVLLNSKKHSVLVEVNLIVFAALGCILFFKSLSASFRAFAATSLPYYGLMGSHKAENILSRSDDCTQAFILLALVIAFLAGSYIMNAGSLTSALALPAVLFVFSTAMHAEVYSTWAVLMALCPMVLMILTGRVRRVSPRKASEQMLWMGVPMVVLMLVLTYLIGPTDYQLPEAGEKAKEKVNAFLETTLGIIEPDIDGLNAFNGGVAGGLSSDELDLGKLAPHQSEDGLVMWIKSDKGGSFYIRAQSYVDYKNSQWVPVSDEQAERINSIVPSPLASEMNSNRAHRNGQLEISTFVTHPMIYTVDRSGLLPEGCVQVGDCYVDNAARISAYTLDYGDVYITGTCTSATDCDAQIPADYAALVRELYLDIPEETAAPLRELAWQNDLITYEEAMSGEVRDVRSTSISVRDFVRSRAVYSLDSGRAPAGMEFAYWFLTEAETGYCTHFASSAVLMLRAMGIPARLVTGYLAKGVPAGEWYAVVSGDAHAWVEVYDAQTGWIRMEPTPASATGEKGDKMSAELTESTSQTTSPSATVTQGSSESRTAATSASAADSSTETSETTTTRPRPVTDPQSGRPTDPQYVPPAQESPDGGCSEGAGVTLVLTAVMCIAGVIFLLTTLRSIKVEARRQSISEGESNDRVLAMWDYIILLSEEGGGQPDPETRRIMQKARFSPHTVTEAELEHVSEETERALNAVKARGGRLSDLRRRYIRFLY